MTNRKLAVSADCESFSLRENALILTIGAVVFDPQGNDTVETLRAAPTFAMMVEPEGQVENYHRHLDTGTVMWWMRQSKEAQIQIISSTRQNLTVAMIGFKDFVLNHVGATAKLWTHGAAEDAVWMRGAARDAYVDFPFHYRNIRDTRTLFDIADLDIEQVQIPGLVDHVALDDAIYQALCIQRAYRKLKEQV